MVMKDEDARGSLWDVFRPQFAAAHNREMRQRMRLKMMTFAVASAYKLMSRRRIDELNRVWDCEADQYVDEEGNFVRERARKYRSSIGTTTAYRPCFATIRKYQKQWKTERKQLQWIDESDDDKPNSSAVHRSLKECLMFVLELYITEDQFVNTCVHHTATLLERIDEEKMEADEDGVVNIDVRLPILLTCDSSPARNLPSHISEVSTILAHPVMMTGGVNQSHLLRTPICQVPESDTKPAVIEAINVVDKEADEIEQAGLRLLICSMVAVTFWPIFSWTGDMKCREISMMGWYPIRRVILLENWCSSHEKNYWDIVLLNLKLLTPFITGGIVF